VSGGVEWSPAFSKGGVVEYSVGGGRCGVGWRSVVRCGVVRYGEGWCTLSWPRKKCCVVEAEFSFL